MTLIRLHYPVASSRRLERIHMFPGRHLGEEEFDRIQDYSDARLAALLRGARAGIVSGLEINLGPITGAEPGFVGIEIDLNVDETTVENDDRGFSVSPGIAIAGNGQTLGLYYPLRAVWRRLLTDYLDDVGDVGHEGVYYLMLERDNRAIDTPTVEPCQRAELDPTRDSRLVVVSHLKLRRLPISPTTAADPDQRETIENWIAADRVDASFLNGLGNAVPMALLAIGNSGAGNPQILWLSQEAGRYEAVPHSGYRVLLNQVSSAMRRVMRRAATEVTNANPLPDFLDDNLDLDYLPAVGQLPLEWLQDPASTTPSILWLPTFLGIDMVPVPEEAVMELMHRHLARRVIDLRHPAGDKIRLLLAVNEPDYRRDLLDIPQTDAQLEQDLYRFFMRAYDAWNKWRQQFNVLYHLNEETVLTTSQIAALDLPKPLPAPIQPRNIFLSFIARAKDELGDGTTAPYPYFKGQPPMPAEPPVPTMPAFYNNWLVPGTGGTRIPPPVPTPTEDGLVPRYAVGLVELEALENQAREMRTRLEKTRDYLMLQRQQLDSQTVALAALAGGVAGDGTGLQVARWLPFTSLTAAAAAPPPTTEETRIAKAVGAGVVGTGLISTGLIANELNQNVGFAISQPQELSVIKPVQNASLLNLSGLSSTLFTSGIKNQPASASAFELNINQSRLGLLANLPKKALTKPAFEAKEYRFGVMDHINPEINEYAKAYRGMAELITTIDGLFDVADAKSLKAKLKVAGVLKTPEVVDAEVPADQPGQNTRPAKLTQARYVALFTAGKVLTQQIAIVEARYNGIEPKLERKLREISDKQASLNKLSAMIRIARETLETADRFRVEQLGDYGVAQRLIDEDWRHVHDVNKERTRILTTALRGLYYVRVRSTPVASGLADPLALRHGSSRDIVPGCDWTEDVELPQELLTFFNAVSEIPMHDWAVLRPLEIRIPIHQPFDYLNSLRQSRFKSRTNSAQPSANTDTLQARLKTVHQQTHVLLQKWAQVSLPIFTISQNQTQAEAARVLSLEDLASTGSGILRKPAHELREKLEHCQHCLLENLNQLPPSLRLQWAQLAEDDQLRVEDVSWWPGLDKAERDDFNATRTVAELIAWWFRQIASDASGNSRSAMRNMVRATLIVASLGDPSEIIRGSVHVPPRSAAIGERLQVKLNRAPTPGTRLHLLDPQQKVVAVLAVEDHGLQSTQVKIVELMQAELSINTRFNVVANKRTTTLTRL